MDVFCLFCLLVGQSAYTSINHNLPGVVVAVRVLSVVVAVAAGVVMTILVVPVSPHTLLDIPLQF